MPDMTLTEVYKHCMIGYVENDGGYVWKIVDDEGDTLKMVWSPEKKVPEGWRGFASNYVLGQ